MLFATVIHGKTASCWNTIPRSRPVPVMRFPSSVMEPSVGAYNPAIILRSVDFPQPEVPTMVLNLPDRNSRLISSSTVSASGVPVPKVCDRSLIRIDAEGCAVRRSRGLDSRLRGVVSQMPGRIAVEPLCSASAGSKSTGRPGSAITISIVAMPDSTMTRVGCPNCPVRTALPGIWPIPTPNRTSKAGKNMVGRFVHGLYV